MALIRPFKGVMYQNISSSVMAPPYDVIDKNERERLATNNPYNIVKITLPDTYDSAKQLVDLWLSSNVLKFDKECAYYIYTAEYEFDGIKKLLKGFLAALKLEEFGGHIKPHEKTLKGPKIDRFNLITKTNAMFCPIMGLYFPNENLTDIIENTINSKKPAIDIEFEGIRHKLYPLYEKSESVSQELQNEDVIIADGHHRYETALMIKEYFNKQGIKNGGFDYIMTLMIDAKAGGLSLFPIHRLIKKVDDFKQFTGRLKEYFTVENGKHNCDFLMYHSGEFYSLKFKQKRSDDLIEKLDVSVFERYIYQNILGLTKEDITNQKVAGYAHSQKEVIELVDKGEADIGFILNPMDYDDLVAIAEKGLTVPQKSTFFHPKIPSGLVGYHFESIKGCENV